MFGIFKKVKELGINLDSLKWDFNELSYHVGKNYEANKIKIESEISKLKKDFRNQLEAEKNKFDKKIDRILTNPPKYKKGDVVWYGDEKFTVDSVTEFHGKYKYYLWPNDEKYDSSFFYSKYTKAPENALYTKEKKK